MALGMAQRFFKTGKFMPAGLVAVLGAACCAYNTKKAIEWAPSKSGKDSAGRPTILVMFIIPQLHVFLLCQIKAAQL